MRSKKNKTILIVEDEPALRQILRDVLEENHFTLLEATNGKDAITLALQKHPDLILLDIVMPEMNGMEALDEIRKDAWGAHVPVIILTNLSADSEELVENVVKDRPLYYLVKSEWNILELAKKIKQVLKA